MLQAINSEHWHDREGFGGFSETEFGRPSLFFGEREIIRRDGHHRRGRPREVIWKETSTPGRGVKLSGGDGLRHRLLIMQRVAVRVGCSPLKSLY